jgi:ribosome-binding factor A
MARRTKKGPSQRTVQVGEQIKHVISESLLEGVVDDARIAAAPMITVTEVRMTPDLKIARVYVSVLGQPADHVEVAAENELDAAEAARPVVDALVAAEALLKREIARRLKLRFTPRLMFAHDDSIRYGAHMEAVIADVLADDERD